MRSLTCMCETVFEANLPEEIDLDENPETLSEILSGDFLSVNCPNCGARLKPELRIRLISRKTGIDIVALPESERATLYRGTVDLPKGAQVVVGFPELFERARILVDSLDPEAIEILKYLLYQKAVEKSSVPEISVAYAGKKGDRLIFHLSGLKEDQVAVVTIDPSTYAKTVSDKSRSLQEPPFDSIVKSPYRSFRILEAETED